MRRIRVSRDDFFEVERARRGINAPDSTVYFTSHQAVVHLYPPLVLVHHRVLLKLDNAARWLKHQRSATCARGPRRYNGHFASIYMKIIPLHLVRTTTRAIYAKLQKLGTVDVLEIRCNAIQPSPHPISPALSSLPFKRHIHALQVSTKVGTPSPTMDSMVPLDFILIPLSSGFTITINVTRGAITNYGCAGFLTLPSSQCKVHVYRPRPRHIHEIKVDLTSSLIY